LFNKILLVSAYKYTLLTQKPVIFERVSRVTVYATISRKLFNFTTTNATIYKEAQLSQR